jgi:glycosyltransferase involved in cell wall biosynthesis
MPLTILTVPSSHGLMMPLSGAQARLFHLVKRLRSIGNTIVVLEDEGYSNPQESELVTPYYFKDIRAASRHLIILRDFNFHFVKALHKILKNEDIDIVEFSYPAGIIAAKCIIELTGKRIPIIFSPCDFLLEYVEVVVTDPKYTPLETWLLRAYTRFMEWLACKVIADQIIVVSERDRKLFIDKYHLPRRKTRVIASGSDIVDARAHCAANTKVERVVGIDQDKTTIFFHGLYSHPANREAIDIIRSYIAPQFKADSRVQFLLGGTEVPEFSDVNVRSIGFIKELPNTLANVDIAIVPVLRGGGTRLKVIDYLAASLPIVTTQKGAEGIGITNGEQAIIVDSVGDEFIDAIKFLIDNDEERRRIGSNARKLAEERFSWDKIGDSLYAAYEQLLSSG